MSKLLKICCLIFFCFICMSADKKSPTSTSYTLRINNIWEDEFHNYVQLNDGTKWESLRNDFTLRTWLAGDEIHIIRKVNNGWILQNLSFKDRAVFKLNEAKDAGLPSVIYIDNAGGSITLTDGSSWKISPWNRLWGETWKWQPGNHIIISPQTTDSSNPSNTSYLLINIDQDQLSSSANMY